MHIKLSDRQQHVLWATIRHYVATARPVGSEALLEEFNLNVSSATVRNAMGRLEKVGLLYQPHTSAGRVPSDSGYRIYVDKLLTPSEVMRQQVQQVLSEQLNWESWSLDAALRGAAHILAHLSGCIALITPPQTVTTSLRHIQLVQVDARRLMLIVVLDSFETQSMLLTLPQSQNEVSVQELAILEQELELLSNFLNHHLRGRSLQEISALDWGELGREFDHYAQLLQASLAELGRRLTHQVGQSHLLVSGVAEVLRRQPEFAEIQQVQTIMQLLEVEQDQLLPLFFEDGVPSPEGRVTVRIGTENPLEPIQFCTLVSATYHWGDSATGSVGVLGPTRMVYEDAIALVEATADHLSEVANASGS
ncbi:MAG: heat-inducible transcriptional repressor HrcA [Elainellaceae cyanobacterium]